MTIEYLKKADKTAATGEDDTRKIVADMLGAIEQSGEAKARAYAEKLDGWTQDIVITREEIEAAAEQAPPVALSAYFLKGVVPEWDLKDIYGGMMQFMGIQLFGLILIITFPQIVLWLPEYLYPSP